MCMASCYTRPRDKKISGVKNHFKNSFWLLVTAVFLAGCAETPDVTTYVDPLTNQRTELLSENELVQPGVDHPREIIWLNASRIPVTRAKYNLYLEVKYGANAEAGPLDILPGTTLRLIADGKELKFSGLGSMGVTKKNGNLIFEDARYEAQNSDIDAIANAQKVTVLLQGKNLLIERNFAPDNFDRFKNFAARIGTPGPAAGHPTVKGL